MTTAQEELKPCPFCSNTQIGREGDDTLFTCSGVHCRHCGANFSFKNLPNDNGYIVACRNWNRRAQQSAHAVEVCPECDIAGCIHIRQKQQSATVSLGWQPIETAPRDGTHVLVKFKDDLTQYEGMATGSLERWQGLPFVGRHRGDIMEWGFAAPVGCGGFPDAWLAGWMPLPKPPSNQAAGGEN